MSGTENSPTSFIEPALERALRIERASIHLARVVELELTDISLTGEEIDERTKSALHKLGGAFLRLSTMSMNLTNSIADSIGKSPLLSETSNVQPLLQPTTKESQDITVPDVIQHESVTPTQSPQPSPKPHVSRLDQVRHRPTEPSSEESTKRTRERKKQEGELYQAIITTDKTPQLELREGRVAKEVVITSDNTINIRDHEISLENDELFIFNGFMLLRNGLITAKDIRSLGFRPDASDASSATAFSKAVNTLLPAINQAAGVELIKKLGERRNTKYAVNPDLTLVDKREIIVSESDDIAEIVKKN